MNDDGRLEAVVMEKDPHHDNDQQLVWHELTRFKSQGVLYGSVLDGGQIPNWSAMNWLAKVPADTGMVMQVRTYHHGVPGPFVTVPTSGTDLGILIDPAARYLQYRVYMSSQTQEISPVLWEVSVEK